MRRLSALLACLGFLAACAPVETYYKPGAPVARLSADTTDCRVDALRQVPVANQTVQEPARYVPPRQYCNAEGRCYFEPAEWIPGAIRTVDVNAGLRDDVTDQCMARKGYAPVSLPACPPGTPIGGPAGILPTLTPQSCAIRGRDGGLAIGTAP